MNGISFYRPFSVRGRIRGASVALGFFDLAQVFFWTSFFWNFLQRTRVLGAQNVCFCKTHWHVQSCSVQKSSTRPKDLLTIRFFQNLFFYDFVLLGGLFGRELGPFFGLKSWYCFINRGNVEGAWFENRRRALRICLRFVFFIFFFCYDSIFLGAFPGGVSQLFVFFFCCFRRPLDGVDVYMFQTCCSVSSEVVLCNKILCWFLNVAARA